MMLSVLGGDFRIKGWMSKIGDLTASTEKWKNM